MPVSKRRKKDNYVPAVAETEVSREPVNLDSPRWLAPAMVFFMVTGVLWVVAFYIISQFGVNIPVMSDLGNLANVGIGFGLMSIGFILATRWK
jgi:hypothetical protein